MASTNTQFKDDEFNLVVGDLDWDLWHKGAHGLEPLLHRFADFVEAEHLFSLGLVLSVLSDTDVSDSFRVESNFFIL